MPAKQMLYEADARAAMMKGISKLAAAVKVTLGPTGRNVLLQKSYGGPKVTKDGVTVSKEIELPNPFENMGAKMANQVAARPTTSRATARPRRSCWPRPSWPRG